MLKYTCTFHPACSVDCVPIKAVSNKDIFQSGLRSWSGNNLSVPEVLKRYLGILLPTTPAHTAPECKPAKNVTFSKM